MLPGNLLMNSETRIQSLVWSVVSGLELVTLIVKLLHRNLTDIKGIPIYGVLALVSLAAVVGLALYLVRLRGAEDAGAARIASASDSTSSRAS